ncbi:hypothetical protein DID75_03925 [Candidatus Marinamargulisbacteria bacterium SCGC AG-410-N11]|nr:hypothetical protein DID75_03925 [Candidatus Marinamargulisbacteria bacterium SCGC AG-410-N11]
MFTKDLSNINQKAAKLPKQVKFVPYSIEQIWPYWVTQLFSKTALNTPLNKSVISKNLYFQNWTKLSNPNSELFSLIDKKGLITPFNESWSIDLWLKINDQLVSFSSLDNVSQTFHHSRSTLTTKASYKTFTISQSTISSFNLVDDSILHNKVSIKNNSDKNEYISILFAIRPYTVKSLGSIHSIFYHSDNAFIINNKLGAIFFNTPTNIICSSFKEGDVSLHVNRWDMILNTQCESFLSSSAVEYKIELAPNESKQIQYVIPHIKKTLINSIRNSLLPIKKQKAVQLLIKNNQSVNFDEEVNVNFELLLKQLNNISNINIPNKLISTRLHQTYTFLISNFLCIKSTTPQNIHYLFSYISSLIYLGKIDLAKELFQNFDSFIFSQKLRFISFQNLGHYIFLLHKIYTFSPSLIFITQYSNRITDILNYIIQSRSTLDRKSPFAEGLIKQSDSTGILDYYFIDNIWILNIINQSITLLSLLNNKNIQQYKNLQISFKECIDSFCNHVCDYVAFKPTLAISSQFYHDYRIIDSLQAIYPLNIFTIDDKKVRNAITMIEQYLVNDTYIIDPTNEIGISITDNFTLANIYLKLGNPKAFSIFKWILDQSINTGSWPSHIHPQTNHGSSDGHSIDINSQYYIFIRNTLINVTNKTLHLFPSIPNDWLPKNISSPLSITNLSTEFGTISFQLIKTDFGYKFELNSTFFSPPTLIKLSLPIPIQKIKSFSSNVILKDSHNIEFQATSVTISIYD